MNQSPDRQPTIRSAAHFVQSQLRLLSLVALTFIGLLLATAVTLAKPLTVVQLPAPSGAISGAGVVPLSDTTVK